MNKKNLAVITITSICLALIEGCGPKPGEVLDEAKTAGLTAKNLQGSAHDYLRDMDGGIDESEVARRLSFLDADEAWKAYNRGRNNWVVWTAGNDTLWDFLANNTFGALDFLKTLSSHPDIVYCGNKDLEYAYEGAEYSGDTYRLPAPYPPGYKVYDHSEKDPCLGTDRKFYEISRDNRWKYLGLVNEPCMKKWTPPEGCNPDTDEWACGNPKRFGLWIDQWDPSLPSCPAGDLPKKGDIFEDEKRYPGVKIGARGEEMDVGSYYGYASGIVGLRLFPNPAFNAEAREAWGNGRRFYEDPKFYGRSDLVRPYRVGMSCGFCHVGPSPVNPPEDFENPRWANLNSNPGTQYFWIDRIFFWNAEGRHENFVYQLFHTSLPGSLDTSLVSSDNINNPRTMNAVYSIQARLQMALFHEEKLAGGSLNNKQFDDYKRTETLQQYFKFPDTVRTAHVLKDGADSVGILGALNRVYLNIGLFSEEWLLHFTPLIGNLPGKRITPIEISVLEENSTYWQANVAQTPDVALFFAASALPDRLQDVKRVGNGPSGAEILLQKQEAARIEGGFETANACADPSVACTTHDMLQRGKIVFAENCARCHSGKQPTNLCEFGKPCGSDKIMPDSAAYFDWMRTEVLKPNYLKHNFLSTETRIPVTELGTNACSPLATNGVGGDIWDNFTSQTYKELPAVGKFTVHHPKTGEPWQYEMPGGGRGYTRPASLISLWSTAPYLLNNSVGNFYGEATLEARIASFDDSIEKMLWPEMRRKDSVLGDKVPGYIQRTTATSSLKVPSGYLPGPLRALLSPLHRWAPFFVPDEEEGIEIGPIPKGTPVGLLANLPFVSDSKRLKDKKEHFKDVIRFVIKAKKDLKQIERETTDKDMVDEKAREVFANLIDDMVKLSKCPDYVVNRGHYFGSNLSDKDKLALIEFLRTF